MNRTGRRRVVDAQFRVERRRRAAGLRRIGAARMATAGGATGLTVALTAVVAGAQSDHSRTVSVPVPAAASTAALPPLASAAALGLGPQAEAARATASQRKKATDRIAKPASPPAPTTASSTPATAAPTATGTAPAAPAAAVSTAAAPAPAAPAPAAAAPATPAPAPAAAAPAAAAPAPAVVSGGS